MDKSNHHTSETRDVSYIQNPDVTHEGTDVRIRPIFWFIFWLIVSAVVINVLMYGLFKVFEQREARRDPPAPPLASERQTTPPEPQLQLIPSHDVSPFDELRHMQEQEEQELTTYGWVDQRQGIVRIPIEEAKRKLIEQGVPTRKKQ